MRQYAMTSFSGVMPLLAIDLAQLLHRLERPISIGGRRPGNILRAGNMAAALCSLLRVIHHVDQFAGILVGRANIHQYGVSRAAR